MRNIKLIVSYDGTDFSGWQRQRDRRTVQEEIEAAIARLTGAVHHVNASGRTDAGVHALGQVANFRTESAHPPEVFRRALNAFLPRDVRVLEASEVPLEFHATISAKKKMYRYVVDNGSISDPFRLRYAYALQAPRLDESAMKRSAQALLGTHDFRSFETHWPNRTTSVRTIMNANVYRSGDLISIEVEADGFLYNMVRSIAGTLINVGKGLWSEDRVAEVVAALDRRAAGPTAPPQGLYLVRVDY
jgi:tRNA pseudouridine38-40 synthase